MERWLKTATSKLDIVHRGLRSEILETLQVKYKAERWSRLLANRIIKFIWRNVLLRCDIRSLTTAFKSGADCSHHRFLAQTYIMLFDKFWRFAWCQWFTSDCCLAVPCLSFVNILLLRLWRPATFKWRRKHRAYTPTKFVSRGRSGREGELREKEGEGKGERVKRRKIGHNHALCGEKLCPWINQQTNLHTFYRLLLDDSWLLLILAHAFSSYNPWNRMILGLCQIVT